MAKIKIENYSIKTGMGTLIGSTLPFLSKEELKEFDKIGYTGKNNAGKHVTYSEFLNSLDKGEFQVNQTRFGSDDYIEKYIITRAYLK